MVIRGEVAGNSSARGSHNIMQSFRRCYNKGVLNFVTGQSFRKHLAYQRKCRAVKGDVDVKGPVILEGICHYPGNIKSAV
jgi:hypothetical protein